MGKENVVYIYIYKTKYYSASKQGGNTAICDSMNEARGLLREKLLAEEQTLCDSLYTVSKTVNLEKPSRVVVSRAAGRGRPGLLLGW